MRSKTRWTLAGFMALVALAAVAAFDVAPAAADAAPSVVSTVSDPVGDALFSAPAFQDVVFGRMTKTASGDFELLLELAGPVPVNPPMPTPARSEIWWAWAFDLDPTTFPEGYPFRAADGRRPEFMVYVSWDGNGFAGAAIDRRPLLTGGEAVITPVAFKISGTIVEAVLPSALIGDVPASFHWAPVAFDWSGPVGSEGVQIVYLAEAVFNP